VSRCLVTAITVGVVACGGGSGATPSQPVVTLGACRSWAASQRGTGVAAATGSVATQRQALYDAGGGVRAVADKYYAVYFTAGYATAAKRRVLVALHGTGGSPEAEFNDWKSSADSRGYAYLGLKYLDDGSGAYDNETTIYSHIKSMIDEVKANCDFGSAQIFLVGFSRGSAQAFPVSYLDAKDRRFFTASGHNSGAWDPGGPPTPTFAGIAARSEFTALNGVKYWLYCGELDTAQGFPMCDAMVQARTFVQTYGGTVATLFRDPTGTHGGLVRNATALSQLFTYFEGLP